MQAPSSGGAQSGVQAQGWGGWLWMQLKRYTVQGSMAQGIHGAIQGDHQPGKAPDLYVLHGMGEAGEDSCYFKETPVSRNC